MQIDFDEHELLVLRIGMEQAILQGKGLLKNAKSHADLVNSTKAIAVFAAIKHKVQDALMEEYKRHDAVVKS
jgi:hypothetical protein